MSDRKNGLQFCLNMNKVKQDPVLKLCDKVSKSDLSPNCIFPTPIHQQWPNLSPSVPNSP